jgi:hypothetical protein
MRGLRIGSLSVMLTIFCSIAYAQCENGQCRPTPVRNTVATVVQAQPVRSAVRVVYQAVASVRQSGGSTGSQSYGSSGSAAFRVGGYDQDGAPIQWIGTGTVVSSTTIGSTGDVSSMWFGSRKRSRQVIVEAAEKAQAEGTIDASQLQAIKLAARSPRMLARIEDLILEKAQSSGAYQFQLDANGDVVKSAINWEAIGDFILKIAPLIFKLIEMFAIYEQAGDVMGMAMVLDQLDYLATIHWQAQAAC